jgi:hypothetical protein
MQLIWRNIVIAYVEVVDSQEATVFKVSPANLLLPRELTQKCLHDVNEIGRSHILRDGSAESNHTKAAPDPPTR